MDPGEIPNELKVLTEAERRLLSRIVTSIKIIKFSGRFGQYGFKGHATLFSLDIFEVTENLEKFLPRSSRDANIVVITETLENLNYSRDYTINRDHVKEGLEWLKVNNPLYHDVDPDFMERIEQLNQDDLIRVTSVQQPENEPFVSAYKPVDKKNVNCASKILRATWNQSTNSSFHFPGVQCFGMALANIVRASFLCPNHWTKLILDENMIEGDLIYTEIFMKTEQDKDSFPIPTDNFLELRNLNIIKNEFIMFEKTFTLEYCDDWLCQGNLMNKHNDGDISKALLDGLKYLFVEHYSGVLVSCSKTIGLMKYDEKFYFTDSHSCGEGGAPTKNMNGKGCIIECDTIEELHRICRRVFPSKNEQYSIHYIEAKCTGSFMNIEDYIRQNAPPEEPLIDFAPQENFPAMTEHLPIQTSLMAPIETGQPDVEDEIAENENVNEIKRKTNNNIVNFNHEKRFEEYAWYFYYPKGINGLHQEREVKISVLDYFQARILGKDKRFQDINYLFFALSLFEFYRTKDTISACCKKVQGKDGSVEDIHLYMKNLRGSGAYWKTKHNELIAQIRCLGPPTWFITLSCNDLNWLDMRKALLIADERSNVDPASISIDEAQKLIEKYPVVVCRHFNNRRLALMNYLKANNDVLGGKVKDFWWRIEFQNRGSPHVHMVVWIENVPSFETAEGIKLVDEIISCEQPSESEDYDLHHCVKRNQVHRHTQTCYKNNSEKCRFGFPRPASETTKIVSETSDEFIRNGGRICILKRKSGDEKINNYNPTILKIWDANIDIQPCGSNESLAYYVAKYMSKSEPTNLNESVAQAISEIRRENTNIAQKLFKVCMRILKERQVSACECVFRLCRLPLCGSSRKCVFLNTRKPDQRYYVLQFQGNQATGVCSNMIERYHKRPTESINGYDFPKMCLMEFSMNFEPHYGKNTTTEEEENVDADNEEVPETRRRFVTLTDGTKMAIRNFPAVVRVPFFMMHRDPENYFYSLLLQYMPHYAESELLDEYENAKEAFLARESELKETSSHMEIFRERDRQLQDAFERARAFDIIEAPMELQDIESQEECFECDMTHEQFSENCTRMNVKQRELFNYITRCIEQQLNGSHDRLKFFVTGGAGSGKTFTLRLLKYQINLLYAKQAVKVAALTGVAAKLVDGSTLHSMLKLPVQKDGFLSPTIPPLTGHYLKIMRQQWKNVEFIFIDEISMVSYEMLRMIDTRLRQLKKKENEVFGGINIIVFGDLAQLAPVKGAQVFFQPIRFQPEVHLWRLFTLVELKENMRQQGDTTFTNLLNALRVGELNNDHFKILMSKQLKDEEIKEKDGIFSLGKSLRIYPLRKQVEDHNNAVLQQFRESNIQINKIVAQDRLVDATRNADNIDLSTIISSDENKTGGLPKEIEIFIGAKVMLRSNINVEKGLVNGSIGYITDIKWPHFRRAQMYSDDVPSVEINFGNNTSIDPNKDQIHLIEPISVQFPALRNFGTVERRMLPLILCWACTVHKMQGSTIDYAVIYLGKSLFQDGQAYVALSRVRSLEGLRIEELDCGKLTGKVPCNEKALHEMERMRNHQPINE